MINSNITIALKNHMIKYEIRKVSIFKLSSLKYEINSIKNVIIENRQVCLEIVCPLCGQNHKYEYSIQEVLNSKLIVGGCKEIYIPLFYIGDQEKVLEKVKLFNSTNNKVYALL
ncbi:hypothetical protein [Clostridium peptidivorans]|uniref:hypothetical protein n=1 Tax=Clostridium peptidivorans TaxID=100174 RepID=UPI000BE3ED7A|nr:hypothetical protein [Clostridium peptidivorans]